MEQRTTYRLVRTLDRLGVHPTPTRKNIRLLMRMSRGNDLAFLWFLMELCHKTEGHGHTYDVNEQIIMSAIFWLDLNPTLRELDRILPLPHDSAANRAKAEVIEKRKQSKEKLNFRLSLNQLEKKSPSTFRPLAPYFEKPVSRRHWQAHRKLVADYPEQPALINPVPQETALSSFWSRWFGDHNFSEGHRVATSVLYAEINHIFESMKAVNITSNKVGSMCAHHQRISEMEKSLELELEVMKQEKLKELVMGKNRADQRHRKRVIEELNQMTACFQAQFHVMATKARKASTRKHLITGTKPDIISMPELFGVENWSDDENCHPTRSKISHTDVIFSDKKKNVNVKLLKGDNPIIPTSLDIMPEPMECINCNIYDPKNGLPDGPAKRSPRPSSVRLFLQLCVLNCEEDGSLDKLVARAAKRIFQKDTEIFHHEYERLMRRKAQKKLTTGDRLDFGQQFYDCADIKLMKHMLRKGLDKVGENRRYVLPTLPDVESVPYLVEWICYRYGKRYSKAELNHSFAEATLFMESLTLLMKRHLVKAPRVHFKDYNFNDMDSPKFKRLAKKLKQRYRNNFVESVMEVGRVFYSAMRPQLCGHLAPESTFYAYMPAKYHDTGFSIARPYKIRKPPLIKKPRMSV
ncbi:uncharacterized protein Dwil_GK14163 [Drosophila willistoni]|uniref:DUF4771 domain-containing protein n=1 Tax=Drosophila willistoni TaxID=7260 RepID=B4NH12_DROWI|nr:uncharacterized protein Dwil_GK14163 [Drosophila willistoni]